MTFTGKHHCSSCLKQNAFKLCLECREKRAHKKLTKDLKRPSLNPFPLSWEIPAEDT